MRFSLTTVLAILLTLITYAQSNELSTLFEQSGGKRTPRYEETIGYCKKLAASSALIHYTTFGRSPQGRELPLLIADRKGYSTPEEVATEGNAVLMIQACIHAGESDGKDAGFMLLRDIITKPEFRGLLDHVTILFIPIFNVDGHERFGPYNRINQNGPEEMGWRTTARNLNLNRDYLKADAPEMQSWLSLYSKWLPDFLIDIHVTDGADYQYVITYAMETLGDLDPNLTAWTKEVCEPFLKDQMFKNRYPIFPYVEFRRWHDPRSGLMGRIAPPMLSQGYTSAQNRAGLLIETHMLKPYKQRVEATYTMIRLVLELLNKEHSTLRKIVRHADQYASGRDFRTQDFPVSWTLSQTDSIMTDFLGFEYTIDTSDLSGGLWFRYDNTKPVTWKIPLFDKNSPEKMVKLPEAYIIPPEYTDLMERLKLHGVIVNTLPEDADIQVSMMRFSDVKWQTRSYEGRLRVNYLLQDSIQNYRFPKGSALVDMNQRTARVIAHLLEPGSPDSYAAWGFFNSCMEIKEYFESYVMEVEARKMLDANPALKTEYDAAIKADPSITSDPYSILGWFYRRSPWVDSRYNVYPVGRILDRNIVNGLLH